MSLLSRILPGLALAQRAEETTERLSTTVYLPPRDAAPLASDDAALGLIPIYRALSILTTSAGQLPLTVERLGRTDSGDRAPALIRKPDPDLDRSDWIEQATLSLALDGNLFLRKITGPDGAVLAARILPPAEVAIIRDPKTRAITYSYRGETLARHEIVHQTLMRLPGRDRGIGPIQAARREIGSAVDVRDYATNWFHGSGQPTGLLVSKGSKTAAETKAVRDAWNAAAASTDNPTGVRVVGGDTEYHPLLLAPEDAQWLEVRQFTVTDLARLFGIPSALMLVSLDGNSLTYSNVEQEWLAFTRFTLMQYLRKIEEALTEITPLGQVARFNIEALLRADTRTRYESHEIALRAGFLTPDEVRAIEGLAPFTAAQRATLAAPALQEIPA